ncbi:MAG: hypothetical protein WAO20_08210 [Acidobacteriota bacterium]
MSWLWLLAGAWGVGLLLLGLAMCRLGSLSDAARRQRISGTSRVEWWPRRVFYGRYLRRAASARAMLGGSGLRDRRRAVP